MTVSDLRKLYENDDITLALSSGLIKKKPFNVHLKGNAGSSVSFRISGLFKKVQFPQLVILNDKEEAAYHYNDLQNIIGKDKVFFYPESHRFPYQDEDQTKNANIIQRAEVLNEISSSKKNYVIVTYPKALVEKVVSEKHLKSNSLSIKKGDDISIEFLMDVLFEYDFDRTDFVTSPGEFSIRGGIVDVFSFSHDKPYRLEFFGDTIDSIRVFDPGDQLSIEKVDKISILPNISTKLLQEDRTSFLEYLHDNTLVWWKDYDLIEDQLGKVYEKAVEKYEQIKDSEIKRIPPNELYVSQEHFKTIAKKYSVIEFGNSFVNEADATIRLSCSPQPAFNKKFDLFKEDLKENQNKGIKTFIFADNTQQIDRLKEILEGEDTCGFVNSGMKEGFIDLDNKIALYTDHQIFDRYHKFKLKDGYRKSKQALTIKELTDLQKGDFVVHVDHGIGRFDGLEIQEFNGKQQETIRLIYGSNDLLYVGIHSLHKVSKYSGKEGKEPKVNKLGTQTWSKKKEKAKSRVKELAFDLIKVYAERKAKKGYEYSPDTYLQHELEASFLYQDTPDQATATQAVKDDMEQTYPMDRLICGDVGFGKTEIAIRAAFKAVADSKQVAILVPTTILALQHYKNLAKRFKDFPCTVDYVNRFKTGKKVKDTLKKAENGEVDILIGTHRIIGKDVKFKDLGLLIIDEEQKFGVSVKEKLKSIKVDVDVLTMTATPIPRTLQFSLMGARDLSVINTPPPNRYPIETQIIGFNEDIVRDAISYEISRGGQVFFIHNRVQNITEVAGKLQRLLPDAKIGIGHGQMEGKHLEEVMMNFIEGQYDVLVATTIIESGLDVPNANTIIINQAQNFGLSDLHQMRGRVGRSNKKAFCYLVTPPMHSISTDARKRLRALEEFSELGSGFNIAMRDLDIRGAGDLLGAEQSGFMSDIGYETYQKILEEALHELKENEFAGLFEEENKSTDWVLDCQIDTDLEVRIPSTYVNKVAERLSIYKDLNDCANEEEIGIWAENMVDRFGEMPESVVELMDTIRMRWIGKELGIERIYLKNGVLRCYFVGNQESPFYQSDQFTKILHYVQENPMKVTLKEIKEKLAITFNHVDEVRIALKNLKKLKLEKEVVSE